MKISDIIRTAPRILSRTGEAICLAGPPGVGKTSIQFAIAEELARLASEATAGKSGKAKLTYRARVVVQHPAYDEPVDYKGIPIPNERVMHWLPPDNLPLDGTLAMDEDELMLWVLDDIGQAHPQVQNALARAFHASERVIAGRKLHSQVYVSATTNRVEDAAAVFEMPSFARMRVTFLDLHVDAQDWVDWAYSNQEVPEQFISFLHPRNKMGGSKHIMDFDPTRKTNCSPRTLHIAAKHWLALRGERGEVVDEYLGGIVCPSFALEFRAHLKMYEQLPDIEAVLKGEDVDMGFCKNPSILFLTITSLIKQADPEKHAPALAKFILRTPDERTDFMVMLFQEACRKVPKLQMQPDLHKWAMKPNVRAQLVER